MYLLTTQSLIQYPILVIDTETDMNSESWISWKRDVCQVFSICLSRVMLHHLSYSSLSLRNLVLRQHQWAQCLLLLLLVLFNWMLSGRSGLGTERDQCISFQQFPPFKVVAIFFTQNHMPSFDSSHNSLTCSFQDFFQLLIVPGDFTIFCCLFLTSVSS